MRRLLGYLKPLRVLRLLIKLVLATVAGIFLVINRSFLFLVLLYVALYFFVGSSRFPSLIEGVLATEIPGALTIGNAQWGPDPTVLRVAHVRIFSDKHQEVVHAPASIFEIDWPATLLGAGKSLFEEDAPITVIVDRAILNEAWTWVEVREDGNVGIHAAFDDPDAPPRKPGDPLPPALDIHIKSVAIMNHQGWLDSPHFTIAWEDLDVWGDFHVVDSPGTVSFDVTNARIANIDLAFKPHASPGSLPRRMTFPVQDMAITDLFWRGTAFTLKEATGQLDDGSVRVNGTVETKPAKLRLDGTLAADIGANSKILESVFGQLLPVSGAVQVTANGATNIRQWSDAELLIQSRQLKVGDLVFDAVDANIEVSPLVVDALPTPPTHEEEELEALDPEAKEERLARARVYDHRYDIRRFEAQALGGRVAIAKAAYSSVASTQRVVRPQARRLAFDVILALERVNPWALLSSSLLEVGLDELPFLDGRLDGRLQVAGTFDEGSGVWAMQTRTEGVTMSWDAARSGIPLASRYALEGGLRYTLTPPMTGDNDTLEERQELRFNELGLVSGTDTVQLDGLTDLTDGTLDLTANARIQNLSRFLGRVGGSGVDGRVRLTDARIGGTFTDPAVRGAVKITQAELDGRAIGTVSAGVDLSNGLLVVDKLVSATPYGKVKASGRIRLWRESIDDPDPRMPFVVSKLSVEALELAKLVPSVGLFGTYDVVQNKPIEGTASQPLESLRGEVAVTGRQVGIGEERARRFQAKLSATKDTFRVRDAVINLCRTPKGTSKPGSGRCRAGGATLRVTGQIDKRGGGAKGPRLKAHVRTRNMSINAIRALAGAAELRGEVTADVQMEGRLKRPRLFGTIKLTDFGVGPVELGDANLDLTWGRPGEVIVTAMQFFDRMTLEESLVDLSNGRFKARFNARVDNLAVFSELLPRLEIDHLVDLIGTGQARLDLDPAGRVPWRVRFDAAPGDLTVAVNEGKVRYKSMDPVQYRMVPDVLKVLAPVRLKSERDRVLHLCGGITDDRWDIELAGEIGAELIVPSDLIRDLFGNMRGSVLIAPDKDTRQRPGRSKCLAKAGDNVMLVRGRLTQPTLDGTFVTSGIGFTPRDFGRSVTLNNGGLVKVRPTNKAGRQLIRIEPGRQAVSGEIEDGQFSLTGDLYLQDLQIDDLDWDISGSEIYWASAGEYNLTFNPDVSIAMQNFGDDATRRIRLGGKVLVTDGTYFKSFDSFARAFGAVTGGEGAGYERPLTERVPWLKSLTMDLDVTSTNFTVQSAFPTGKLDLEVRLDVGVTGTLDNIIVKRRVDILPEGTISYNLFRRDFEIRNGFLEFDGEGDRPRIELRADTEVEYLERTSSDADRPDEEKQVTVIVMITGRLPDELNIELSSQPGGFSQADLERLIVTGKPLRDTASAREDTLFSFDFGGFVNTLLKAPFVDAVKLGVTQEGFVDTQIVTKFGRDVRLRTRAVQEAGDSTRLSARFEFRLTDSVVLEGRAGRSTGNDFTNSNERYEARIKYRIPLD